MFNYEESLSDNDVANKFCIIIFDLLQHMVVIGQFTMLEVKTYVKLNVIYQNFPLQTFIYFSFPRMSRHYTRRERSFIKY